MTLANSKLIIIGLLLVLSIISGIGTSKKGKPYNVWIFAAHKIFSVGLLIYFIILIFNIMQTGMISFWETFAVFANILLLLILVVSGALLSIDKLPYEKVRSVHKLASGITIILTAVVIYIFVS